MFYCEQPSIAVDAHVDIGPIPTDTLGITPPDRSRSGREAGPWAGLCFFRWLPMRTIVYVDGFNLYYGLLRGTRHKWLDLRDLFEKLLPRNDIALVKYFTARIVAFPGNPAAPRRQATYLRALRAKPSLEIHFGHFLQSEVTMRLADGSGQSARVIRYEEKGSDVNLAVHLVSDGFKQAFEVAVVWLACRSRTPGKEG